MASNRQRQGPGGGWPRRLAASGPAAILAAAAVLAAAAGASAAPAAMAAKPDTARDGAIGFRGDGTGVFPGSNPPTEWDEASGKNILWKTPMPNWGHGCPIIVKGRVFLLCEPGWTSDWPVLVCLDADSGRALWQREINHLPAAVPDAAERQKIAQTWHDLLARYRQAYTLFNAYFYSEDKEAGVAKFEANGFVYGGWSGGGYGQLRRMRYKDADARREQLRTIARGGLNLETWQHECGMGVHCVGQTLPTPVSDGQFIYVATGLHSFACFDLDGNLRWLKSLRGQGSQGGNDYCKNARNPVLYGDLFISDVGNLVRAFDRRTGALRWSETIAGHEIVSPAVITVGGTDVLLVAGPSAFRLPDGKRLAVEGWSSNGAMALVNPDRRDVVFYTGGGEHGGWEGKGDCETPPPAAVSFRLEGDRLAAKVLWSGVEGQRVSAHVGLLYHQGRLYHPGGFVLDAATGKRLSGPTPGDRSGRAPRTVPQTRYVILLAGGHLYGLRQGRGSETQPAQTGVCEVYTLEGKKVAENVLANAPVEGEKKRQIIETVGWNTWDYSYSCPFTIAGDRLYVRSNDYLYAIGRK